MTLRRTQSPDFKLLLYYLLVFQICVISLSIAAASITFGLMIFVALVWIVRERTWPFRPTALDYFFLTYIVWEYVTAVLAIYPADAFYTSKRLALISYVYFTVLTCDT
jgi:hypothetical protein